MSSRLLIQMSGAPGAGKSSMSALLSKALNGVVIDHDLLKSGFLEKGHSFDKSAKLTYSLQWVLVEDVIKQGQSVIIDCPCNYDEILTNGINLARKYGYEYKYVECRVSDLDLLDQRLRTRTPLRSQRTGLWISFVRFPSRWQLFRPCILPHPTGPESHILTTLQV
jgi:predicted kinase